MKVSCIADLDTLGRLLEGRVGERGWCLRELGSAGSVVYENVTPDSERFPN